MYLSFSQVSTSINIYKLARDPASSGPRNHSWSVATSAGEDQSWQGLLKVRIDVETWEKIPLSFCMRGLFLNLTFIYLKQTLKVPEQGKQADENEIFERHKMKKLFAFIRVWISTSNIRPSGGHQASKKGISKTVNYRAKAVK